MRRLLLSLSSEDVALGLTKGGINFLHHIISCLDPTEQDFRCFILPAAQGFPIDKLSLMPSQYTYSDGLYSKYTPHSRSCPVYTV